jgi:hypothetical protein
MENKDNTPKLSEEVDVTQFFKWIGKGIGRIGDAIIISILYVRSSVTKNKMLFLWFIVAGLILGTFYHSVLKKPYYKATMVVAIDFLDYKILEDIAQRLELMCKESSREVLAQEISISQDTAKLIEDFTIEAFVSEQDVIELELLKKDLKEITVERKGLLESVVANLEGQHSNRIYQISVFVYDYRIIKPLEQPIVRYFKENEFIKRRLQINQLGRVARKYKLEAESKKLDSLKTVLFENFQSLSKTTSRGSNNVILGDEKLTNPLDVFREDLAINSEILGIERSMFLQPGFEVMQGFTTITKPASFPLIVILGIAVAGSIVLCFITIWLLRIDRFFVSLEKRHSVSTQ